MGIGVPKERLRTRISQEQDEEDLEAPVGLNNGDLYINNNYTTTINIVSLNTRGLNISAKYNTIINHFLYYEIDVFAL